MWGVWKWLKFVFVCACMYTRVMSECCVQPRPMKKEEAAAVQMYLSLSPTWNTGNGLFDHYLPVSLPSTGTACYDCWCAALTGQKHTCKLKHVEKKKQHSSDSDWCRHSNSSPRTYNHDDQQCRQSAGLLFYIWIPISFSDCEACWGPHSHLYQRAIYSPLPVIVCLLNVGGNKQKPMWSKGEHI